MPDGRFCWLGKVLCSVEVDLHCEHLSRSDVRYLNATIEDSNRKIIPLPL